MMCFLEIWRSASKHLIQAAFLAGRTFPKSSGNSTYSHLPKSPRKAFAQRNSVWVRKLIGDPVLKASWGFFLELETTTVKQFQFISISIDWLVIDRIFTAAPLHSAPKRLCVGLSCLPSTLFARTCLSSVGTSQAVIHHILQVHNVSGSRLILRWESQVVSRQVKLPTDWKSEYSRKSQNTVWAFPPLLAWLSWCLDSWAYPCSILSCFGKAWGVTAPAETGLSILASFLAALKPPAFHWGPLRFHKTLWPNPQNDLNAESIPSIITAWMKSKLYLVFRRQIENWGFLSGNHPALSGKISHGAVITTESQLLPWFSNRLPFSMNNLPFTCKSSAKEWFSGKFRQWSLLLEPLSRELNAF